MRELDSQRFLVRFPPWKKVEELIEFPAFDLETDGVTVKIMDWDNEISAMSELTCVWVTIKGIPPKWCAWKTFAQVASVIGVLMDIDWPVLFKTFYASVRAYIAVKDVSRIPPGRVVEMEEKFYMVTFEVEQPALGPSSGQDPPPAPAPIITESGNTQTLMDTDNSGAPDGNLNTTTNQTRSPVVDTRVQTSNKVANLIENSHSG